MEWKDSGGQDVKRNTPYFDNNNIVTVDEYCYGGCVIVKYLREGVKGPSIDSNRLVRVRKEDLSKVPEDVRQKVSSLLEQTI